MDDGLGYEDVEAELLSLCTTVDPEKNLVLEVVDVWVAGNDNATNVPGLLRMCLVAKCRVRFYDIFDSDPGSRLFFWVDLRLRQDPNQPLLVKSAKCAPVENGDFVEVIELDFFAPDTVGRYVVCAVARDENNA